MNSVKPTDVDHVQIHTNGTFLEHPKLLEKALKSQKGWEDRVPGPIGVKLPNIAKRKTTLEKALLELRTERERWDQTGVVKATYSMTPNESKLMTYKTNTYNSENEERFEEVLTPPKSSNEEDAVVNWSSMQNNDEPVVVFVRHGRTPHNNLKLFTGWEDPPLAPEGVEDARAAGRLLKKHGFHFDVVYSSWLYRAIQTAWLILEEMDLLWIPFSQSWRLNERH